MASDKTPEDLPPGVHPSAEVNFALSIKKKKKKKYSQYMISTYLLALGPLLPSGKMRCG
jgi:hypothetical protein